MVLWTKHLISQASFQSFGALFQLPYLLRFQFSIKALPCLQNWHCWPFLPCVLLHDDDENTIQMLPSRPGSFITKTECKINSNTLPTILWRAGYLIISLFYSKPLRDKEVKWPTQGHNEPNSKANVWTEQTGSRVCALTTRLCGLSDLKQDWSSVLPCIWCPDSCSTVIFNELLGLDIPSFSVST